MKNSFTYLFVFLTETEPDEEGNLFLLVGKARIVEGKVRFTELIPHRTCGFPKGERIFWDKVIRLFLGGKNDD